MTSIGDFTFPERSTAVDVKTRFADGTTKKVIRIDTILLGSTGLQEFLKAVEDLEKEVEKFDRGLSSLSIVEGRYHQGIRLSLQRTLDPAGSFAAFEILLLTNDRFERSISLQEENINVTASGDDVVITQAGNADAFPEITLSAVEQLINPVISDGTNSLTYNGTLSPGSVLVFDADRKTALLNGAVNALPKTVGSFPVLNPGDTTIVYTDNPASSHKGSLAVRYRDTWV